jgi:hypothetical protein
MAIFNSKLLVYQRVLTMDCRMDENLLWFHRRGTICEGSVLDRHPRRSIEVTLNWWKTRFQPPQCHYMSLYVTKVSVNWNHDSSHMIITDSQMVEHRQMKPQTSCVEVCVCIYNYTLHIYIWYIPLQQAMMCILYTHIFTRWPPTSCKLVYKPHK